MQPAAALIVTDETALAKKREIPVKSVKMQFVLVGFTQEMGFRLFTFEGIAADRTRTKFTVTAELALIGRYGIRMQELPLLCCGLLERRDEGESKLAFTEEEMRLHASNCAAARDAAKLKRKPPRRPSAAQAATPWRGPQA